MWFFVEYYNLLVQTWIFFINGNLVTLKLTTILMLVTLDKLRYSARKFKQQTTILVHLHKVTTKGEINCIREYQIMAFKIYFGESFSIQRQ